MESIAAATNIQPTLQALNPLAAAPVDPGKGEAVAAAPVNPGRGKAFAAISAAIIWPGLGHLIAGRVIAAFAWCGLWIAILAGFVLTFRMPEYLWALSILIPVGFLVRLVQMLDAARAARKSKHFLFHTPMLRFFAGIFCTVIAVSISQNQINWLLQNYIEFASSPTASMSPALTADDVLLTYKSQPIHRWDVVGVNAPIISSSGYRNVLKRVVGLPGDKVEIIGGALLINDQPQPLPGHIGPYIPVNKTGQAIISPDPTGAAAGCWGRPITLGPDEFYVLGDNSLASGDARVWPAVGNHQPGAMPRDRITSRAVYIVWPPGRVGPVQ
jgi:signal peptidase I